MSSGRPARGLLVVAAVLVGCASDYDAFLAGGGSATGSGGDATTTSDPTSSGTTTDPGSGGGATGGQGSSTTSAGGSSSPGGGGGGPPAPGCGDGHIDPGEECDDGNTQPADGCSGCVVDCAGTKDPATHHCYEYVATPLSWASARQACQQLGPGTDLAVPSTTAEIPYLLALAIDSAWVGGSDQLQEGTFTWIDGSPWLYSPGQAPWQPGQPNNNGDEDCVVLGDVEDAFFDVSCALPYAAICERVPLGN